MAILTESQIGDITTAVRVLTHTLEEMEKLQEEDIITWHKLVVIRVDLRNTIKLLTLMKEK